MKNKYYYGNMNGLSFYLYRGCSVVWNTWEAVIRFSMYCPRTWKHILKTLVTHTLNQMFIYLIFWSEPQVLLLDVVHLAAEVLQRVLQLQHLADQPRLLLQVVNWVLLKSCCSQLNVIMICCIVPDSSPCLCVVVVWWLTVIRCSRFRCSHSTAAALCSAVENSSSKWKLLVHTQLLLTNRVHYTGFRTHLQRHWQNQQEISGEDKL